MKGFTLVDNTDALDDGEMKNYQVNNKDVLLVRLNDNFYAVDGICSHAYAKLWEGEMDDCYVTCPLHFARFDVRDGSVKDAPATEPLSSYEVKNQDGAIWISNSPLGIKS